MYKSHVKIRYDYSDNVLIINLTSNDIHVLLLHALSFIICLSHYSIYNLCENTLCFKNRKNDPHATKWLIKYLFIEK